MPEPIRRFRFEMVRPVSAKFDDQQPSRSVEEPAQALVDEALRRLRILVEREEHAADALDAIGEPARAEALRTAAGTARNWIRDIEEARP